MTDKQIKSPEDRRDLVAVLARSVASDLRQGASAQPFGPASEDPGEAEKLRRQCAQVLTELVFCSSLLAMGLRAEEADEQGLRYLRVGLDRFIHSGMLRHVVECPGHAGEHHH